jgi:DNA-binding NarL/FixJ family response regulator
MDVEPATRVVLIDDHPSLRVGVMGVLEQAGFALVGEAATAADGIALVEREAPDVAIIDLRLPDDDGASVCRSIKARCPDVACLVFSAGDDVGMVADAITAGATGFVFKESTPAGLVSAINVVAGGGETFPEEVADRLIETLRSRSVAGRGSELTAQENTILTLLVEGMSNREVATRMEIAEKTVRNHMTSLLRKLGLRDRTQAALYESRRRK